MSLKDYRALVAPNNDDYFYAKKYRTDCDLFHCKTGAGFHRRRKDEIPSDPSSGRYCLDDMSSCAFTEAEEAGSEYDSGLTSPPSAPSRGKIAALLLDAVLNGKCQVVEES